MHGNTIYFLVMLATAVALPFACLVFMAGLNYLIDRYEEEEE